MISPTRFFVIRIRVGVQQADGDRGHPLAAQLLRDAPHGGFVERRQDLPLGIQPFRDAKTKVSRD